jgi:hypothetical protein
MGRLSSFQRSTRNAGMLGGDVSMERRHKMRDRYIAPLQGVDRGLEDQCFCGGTIYAVWRRRWYCKRCARWVRHFPSDDRRASLPTPPEKS